MFKWQRWVLSQFEHGRHLLSCEHKCRRQSWSLAVQRKVISDLRAENDALVAAANAKWQPATTLPPEGARVFVFSPELQGDFLLCDVKSNQLVPVAASLKAAWQQGSFCFAPVYWRLAPPAPILRMQSTKD